MRLPANGRPGQERPRTVSSLPDQRRGGRRRRPPEPAAFGILLARPPAAAAQKKKKGFFGASATPSRGIRIERARADRSPPHCGRAARAPGRFAVARNPPIHGRVQVPVAPCRHPPGPVPVRPPGPARRSAEAFGVPRGSRIAAMRSSRAARSAVGDRQPVPERSRFAHHGHDRPPPHRPSGRSAEVAPAATGRCATGAAGCRGTPARRPPDTSSSSISSR